MDNYRLQLNRKKFTSLLYTYIYTTLALQKKEEKRYQIGETVPESYVKHRKVLIIGKTPPGKVFNYKKRECTLPLESEKKIGKTHPTKSATLQRETKKSIKTLHGQLGLPTHIAYPS